MNTEIISISIDNLVFDSENPRLPENLRRKKNDSDYENSVLEWMLQFENITELMGSIGEEGYFPAEPILVVPKDEGKYEVAEGNRRLTAVKLLNNPELATKKKKTIEEILNEAKTENIPQEIPSIIFNKREDIIAYLGYKHITGVQAWDSLAKAKYLRQLKKTIPQGDFYGQCKILAKIIGSKAHYVRLLLIGVDIYIKIEEEEFYDISNLREERFDFGVFYTALHRENIGKYIGIDLESEEPIKHLNQEKLKDVTRWIFEKNTEGFTRLGESRNLPKLNKILDEEFPKALQAFKEGKTLDEASRLTVYPREIFQENINDSLSYLEIARDYSHLVDKPTDIQADTLEQIYRLAKDLYQLVNSKLINLESEEIV